MTSRPPRKPSCSAPGAPTLCSCGHPRARHYGPRNEGPCDAGCGCTGYREVAARPSPTHRAQLP